MKNIIVFMSCLFMESFFSHEVLALTGNSPNPNKVSSEQIKNERFEKRKKKLEKKLYKKVERKLKRKLGPNAEVNSSDIMTLVGAIICVIGVISIIGTIIGGLIVAGIGLAIYLIGKANGGSIDNFFD